MHSLSRLGSPAFLTLVIATLSITPSAYAQLDSAAVVVDDAFGIGAALPNGSVELTSSPDLFARLDAVHDAGHGLQLLDLPLHEKLEIDLRLRPVSALAEGARAVVVGEQGTHLVAPSIATFFGHVDGRTGGAFLAVSATQVQGYVSVDGELFFLTSGGSNSGQVLVSRASALPSQVADEPFCKLIRDVLREEETGGPEGGLAGSVPIVRIADVFIEIDHRVRALFSSDQDAIDYAALLVAASNEIYRRDLGTPLRIPDTYLRLWTTVPPWGEIADFNGIVDVQDYWTSAANPLRDIPRASVHVLTNPVFGGVAWNIGGICDNAEGYEVSSIFGSFPYPIEHTSGNNWDLLVVTHEFGHSFGSPHTFSYNPPIDCDDGTGPDNGTIMGYCHQTFGVGGVGMRFHERVQNNMRNYIDSRACIEIVPMQLGDYDYDGDLDGNDLLALDACLAQGFHSEGCLETLDMDGDGALTSCDRRLLEELINGPGQSYCFGGAPCPCANEAGPCEGCGNSTTAGGSLSGSGSSSVTPDDLVLTASGLPQNQNGIFFMGTAQVDLAFGDGRRCVGGQLFRFPVRNSGPSGELVEGPGIVAHSQGFQMAGRIMSGQTWQFQGWFRDPMGPCGTANNVSSAYSVTFTP